MENFWDYSVWGWMTIFGVLFLALIVGNIIKRRTFLKESLIPTSVVSGALILIVAVIYKAITGEVMFDASVFGGNGMNILEIITYHCLALGFIASAFKTNGGTTNKKRATEVFNTGVTTVSTYLLQAVFGLGITIIASLIFVDIFSASGMLLPFGYGQGTGQALNYGNIYETEHGFIGGKGFGLTIAAFGFISASVGGVIHLNVMKKRGKLVKSERTDGSLHTERIEEEGEAGMQESIDKMTIQLALIIVAYVLAYLLMVLLSSLFPGMKAVIYGFNFLLGVLVATLIKVGMNFLLKKGVMRRKYTNNFLMTRVSNFFFDVMIVAGVAAIRIETFERYWAILLVIGIAGLVVTYVYNRIVAKVLFRSYSEEQFMAMFGMLTGTASTGIILLREIDPEFKTPTSDNLVYQNFPAIVFGLPLMFLATMAPERPVLTLVILFAFFIVMNIILFRSFIFKGKKKSDDSAGEGKDLGPAETTAEE